MENNQESKFTANNEDISGKVSEKDQNQAVEQEGSATHDNIDLEQKSALKDQISVEKDVTPGTNQDDDILDTTSKDLETLVSSMQSEIQELHDRLLRSIAETENIRNRNAKMLEEARSYSISSFARDLIPVIDNLSRALKHCPKEGDETVKVFIDGVSLTKTELENAFKKHGLESVSPQKGEKFDYNKHNAISQVMTDEFSTGTIVDVMEVGYKINDRLIRPAIVTVAK